MTDYNALRRAYEFLNQRTLGTADDHARGEVTAAIDAGAPCPFYRVKVVTQNECGETCELEIKLRELPAHDAVETFIAGACIPLSTADAVKVEHRVEVQKCLDPRDWFGPSSLSDALFL